MLGDSWETLSDDFWGDVPRLQCKWGTPKLGAFFHLLLLFIFFLLFFFIIFFFASSNPDACFFFFLSVKVRPKFKSRYKGRIKDASDYAKNLKLQRSDILRCLLGKEIVNNLLNPS